MLNLMKHKVWVSENAHCGCDISDVLSIFNDGKNEDHVEMCRVGFYSRHSTNEYINQSRIKVKVNEEAMTMNMWSTNSRWDVLGAGLSFLCIIHCAILPLLPMILSALPWLGDEKLHLGLLALISPVAIFAIIKGVKCHGRKSLLLWAGIGLALLLSGPMAGEALEKPFTVIGSLTLAGTHLINRKYSCC